MNSAKIEFWLPLTPIPPNHAIRSSAHPKIATGAITALPLKGDKIENFVTFIPNLFPISLKTRHFLNETSKFKAQPPRHVFLMA